MSEQRYCYIGRADCGCIRGSTLDRRDKDTGRMVAKMIAQGLVIERMTMEAFDAAGGIIWECPHEEKQLELPL